jgi:hypothetical protein
MQLLLSGGPVVTATVVWVLPAGRHILPDIWFPLHMPPLNVCFTSVHFPGGKVAHLPLAGSEQAPTRSKVLS